ncbi:MAG TPA: amidohydrolase, partial [Clostridiales bacterium]|nr:amidohydrolase [Clostridiales bacterium]
MKNKIFNYLDSIKSGIADMSDYIFDNPEYDFKEYKAMEVLTEYLDNSGFAVERGIGGLETAFRAIYENGTNGPSIGLLCEYDAIEDLGHACGHHMQGPAIVYAAAALKDLYKDKPYKLVVYG